MPSYDFRCKDCKHKFALSYKSYVDYDTATHQCPNCGSSHLSELVTQVAIQQPTRDYQKMSSSEMLGVLETGDSRAVGEMFQQVGAGDPALGAEYHEATKRLLKGDSMDKVETDLQTKRKETITTSDKS